MRKNKKKIAAICIVICILAAAGLYYRYSVRKTGNIQNMYSWMDAYWINENGLFRQDGEFLLFDDPESGREMVACGKTGCNHTGKDCPGIYAGDVYGVNYDDTGMLFLTRTNQTKSNEIAFCHADYSGENRKVIYTFKNVWDIKGITYRNGILYVSYGNAYDAQGNVLEKPEVGILAYDIKEQKEMDLFHDAQINPAIMTVNADGENVYFTYNYSSMTAKQALKYAKDLEKSSKYQHTELRCVNRKTHEVRTVYTDLSACNYIALLEHQLYAGRKDGIYVYDIKTETSKKIISGQAELVPAYIDGKEQILVHTMEENAEAKYQYWKNGKWIPIQSKEGCIACVGGYAYLLNGEGELCYQKTEDFLASKGTAAMFEQEVYGDGKDD